MAAWVKNMAKVILIIMTTNGKQYSSHDLGTVDINDKSGARKLVENKIGQLFNENVRACTVSPAGLVYAVEDGNHQYKCHPEIDGGRRGGNKRRNKSRKSKKNKEKTKKKKQTKRRKTMNKKRV